MRILCLDVGTKRIGVAISDPLGVIAQGLTTIARRSPSHDIAEIMKLCREYGVERILIGVPLDAEGQPGASAQRIARFERALATALKAHQWHVPIEGVDERYSTVEAEERLIEADMSRVKRRRIIDKMAAVVMLEEYLTKEE